MSRLGELLDGCVGKTVLPVEFLRHRRRTLLGELAHGAPDELVLLQLKIHPEAKRSASATIQQDAPAGAADLGQVIAWTASSRPVPAMSMCAQGPSRRTPENGVA